VYETKGDGTSSVVGRCGDSRYLLFRKAIEANGQEFHVTNTGVSGFSFWSGIQVAIPSTIEMIGKSCFSSSRSLKEVIFESECNLKRISKAAFRNCGLKSIRIPSLVEEKNQGAVLPAVIRYAPYLITFSEFFGGLARHFAEGRSDRLDLRP
jgi:hypothetical protein